VRHRAGYTTTLLPQPPCANVSHRSPCALTASRRRTRHSPPVRTACQSISQPASTPNLCPSQHRHRRGRAQGKGYRLESADRVGSASPHWVRGKVTQHTQRKTPHRVIRGKERELLAPSWTTPSGRLHRREALSSVLPLSPCPRRSHMLGEEKDCWFTSSPVSPPRNRCMPTLNPSPGAAAVSFSAVQPCGPLPAPCPCAHIRLCRTEHTHSTHTTRSRLALHTCVAASLLTAPVRCC
jgi:hypothetical protein